MSRPARPRGAGPRQHPPPLPPPPDRLAPRQQDFVLVDTASVTTAATLPDVVAIPAPRHPPGAPAPQGPAPLDGGAAAAAARKRTITLFADEYQRRRIQEILPSNFKFNFRNGRSDHAVLRACRDACYIHMFAKAMALDTGLNIVEFGPRKYWFGAFRDQFGERYTAIDTTPPEWSTGEVHQAKWQELGADNTGIVFGVDAYENDITADFSPFVSGVDYYFCLCCLPHFIVDSTKQQLMLPDLGVTMYADGTFITDSGDKHYKDRVADWLHTSRVPDGWYCYVEVAYGPYQIFKVSQKSPPPTALKVHPFYQSHPGGYHHDGRRLVPRPLFNHCLKFSRRLTTHAADGIKSDIHRLANDTSYLEHSSLSPAEIHHYAADCTTLVEKYRSEQMHRDAVDVVEILANESRSDNVHANASYLKKIYTFLDNASAIFGDDDHPLRVFLRRCLERIGAGLVAVKGFIDLARGLLSSFIEGALLSCIDSPWLQPIRPFLEWLYSVKTGHKYVRRSQAPPTPVPANIGGLKNYSSRCDRLDFEEPSSFTELCPPLAYPRPTVVHPDKNCIDTVVMTRLAKERPPSPDLEALADALDFVTEDILRHLRNKGITNVEQEDFPYGFGDLEGNDDETLNKPVLQLMTTSQAVCPALMDSLNLSLSNLAKCRTSYPPGISPVAVSPGPIFMLSNNTLRTILSLSADVPRRRLPEKSPDFTHSQARGATDAQPQQYLSAISPVTMPLSPCQSSTSSMSDATEKSSPATPVSGVQSPPSPSLASSSGVETSQSKPVSPCLAAVPQETPTPTLETPSSTLLSTSPRRPSRGRSGSVTGLPLSLFAVSFLAMTLSFSAPTSSHTTLPVSASNQNAISAMACMEPPSARHSSTLWVGLSTTTTDMLTPLLNQTMWATGLFCETLVRAYAVLAALYTAYLLAWRVSASKRRYMLRLLRTTVSQFSVTFSEHLANTMVTAAQRALLPPETMNQKHCTTAPWGLSHTFHRLKKGASYLVNTLALVWRSSSSSSEP